MDSSAKPIKRSAVQDETLGYVVESRKAISDLVRLVSISFLFIFYFTVTDSKILPIFSGYSKSICIIGITGVLGLLFDYLNSMARLSWAEKTYYLNDKITSNDKSYTFAIAMFWAKQISTLIGSGALIYIFFGIGLGKLFPS